MLRLIPILKEIQLVDPRTHIFKYEFQWVELGEILNWIGDNYPHGLSRNDFQHYIDKHAGDPEDVEVYEKIWDLMIKKGILVP